jgi:tRNA dimethylallyltransferase
MGPSLQNISRERPVLIAGPTASGKSALALAVAENLGGAIINADAMQVFANWPILSARPDAADLARATHHLYGHIAHDRPYSVGQWLREIAPLLEAGPRPIIVGGTGLYFNALTRGLADIPPTPLAVRARADARRAQGGLGALLADLDPATLARIDTANPMRVQRAWEVQQTTGRGLAGWQDDTPPPLLALEHCDTVLLEADRAWLNARIAARFDAMLARGALDEARANRPGWSPALPSAKTIGAAQLMAHLAGEITLDQAREAATIASRQFAKRQRSWFRARMQGWGVRTLP